MFRFLSKTEAEALKQLLIKISYKIMFSAKGTDIHLSRIATVREKYLENEIFFQVREKSGNFVDDQGNLERTWKVREKSGNLKINGYDRQSSENLFILFKRGKDVHSLR